MKKIGVALFGMGTVGTGVARLLLESADHLAARSGFRFELRHVVVRDLELRRGLTLPPGIMTRDPERVFDDDAVHIGIEVMGGIEHAATTIRRLIDSGKEIVTANKALLCDQGPELVDYAWSRGRSIAFEAAAAGGIPIVSALRRSLTGNVVHRIEGILNGTSNFILSRMTEEDCSYGEALLQAQAMGYAEADPTFDVDGTDAAQKLAILVLLAFGARVPLESIHRKGIDSLERADLAYAADLGYTIKLLADATLVNEALQLSVRPTLIPLGRPLAAVGGALNAVLVEGDPVGPLCFTGAGAGSGPTASAIVADVIETAIGSIRLGPPPLIDRKDLAPLISSPDDEVRRYYLRFKVDDRPHAFADIAHVLGNHGISLASIVQKEVRGINAPVPVIVVTHETSLKALRAAESELDGLDTIHPPLVRIPIVD